MRTTRSTLLILALSVLAIGLVSALGVRLDRIAQEQVVIRFSQQQLLLADQAADGIQSIFDEARRSLLHVKEAHVPICLPDALGAKDERETASQREACEQGFSTYLQRYPIYTQIRYIDASGQEIAGADSDGEAVRTIPREQLQSQAEREFFAATRQLDAGEVHVSLPEPALGHGGVGGGRLTVRLSTPVFDSQGRRAGIVVLNLLADDIRAHVARLAIEEGVNIWVLDETGVEIINVTYPEREGSNAYEYFCQSGAETLVALAEDMLTGGRGTETYLWPGGEGGQPVVKRLTAYAPVYPAEGHLWSVGTSVPQDSVLAAHRQTRRTLFFMAGGITIVILAGAILNARLSHKRVMAEERARFSEALRRRGEELEALRGMSLEITAQLEPDKLLQNIVERGCRLLGTGAGGVYLFDEARGELEFVVSHGYTRDYVGTRFVPGEGLCGRVLQSGEPLVVDDYSHWEGRASDWEVESLTAVLGVPLKHGEQVIGVLEFAESSRADGFDGHDVWLATVFANQAAVAVENARLYQAEQVERESADTLREISRAVGSTLELDEVLSLVLRQAKRVLTYDTASIMLFANGEPAMVAVAGYEDEELVKAEVSPRLDDSPILQAMAHDHRPVVIADVREDERWIWVPGAEGIRAWIGVPLLVRDEMVGALMVDSARPGSYTEADVAIAQALAHQVAVAVENARLYQAEHRGREVAEALQETARVVNASLNLEQVLPLILEQLAQVIRYDSSAVLLLEDGRFKVTAGRGFPDLEAALRLSYSMAEDNLPSAVMHARRPLIIDDVQADPRWQPDPGITHIHGWIGAPLIARDRVIGVLTVDSRRPGDYNEEDGQLVFAFANQAAVAIENARLFEAEQGQRQEAETLREMALALTTSLDRNQVVQRILIQLQQVVPYDTASIQLLVRSETGQSDRLEIVGGYGFSDLQGVLGVSFSVDEDNPNSEVVRTRFPFIVDDAPATCETFRRIPRARHVRSWLGVPMLVGEQLVGLIALDKQEPGFYAEEHAQLALAFAAQAAIAVENARLYEQARQEIAERQRAEEALKRRATQLATLGEVGRQITSLLELDPLLDHIVNLIREAFAYHYVSILLIDSTTGELALRAGAGYDVEAAKSLRLKVGEDGICGQVVASGEPRLVGDVSRDPDYYLLEVLSDTRSELTVPIQVKGQVVGVLDVQSTGLEALDEEDLFTLRTLADQVAVALENAGLYRELRNHAEELEQRVRERTAQIQAQYARSQAILRSTSDGIIVTDDRGAIIQTNPVAQAWLAQTLSPDDATRLREAVRGVAQRPEAHPETVLELAGLDLELSAAPISEPRTGKAAMVVAIHDVSHLKALNRMKSRFISNVSHELRTPITTIKLYATLLRQTAPEKRGRYLEALELEADQLVCLVEDILQISHVDAGWIEVKPQLTSMNELTRVSVGRYYALARDRSLILEYQPAEPGPVALVDPEQTMQVLNNLVLNAIRYTLDGGRIVVSTGKQEADGRIWSTVTVTDTGIGIPEDELPHIFDRFFRGEEPRLMQVPGTGLGLAIVKDVVEMHGGRVTVESRVGEGTTFTAWLPLA
ncbi:MAG: GAF domain-containing protein [Chloroflexota bacterium]|nr:GAF domain-containing protein [Chloroflexota bacterium]